MKEKEACKNVTDEIYKVTFHFGHLVTQLPFRIDTFGLITALFSVVFKNLFSDVSKTKIRVLLNQNS